MILKHFLSFFLLLNLFLGNFLKADDLKILVKVENEIITSFEFKNKVLGTLLLANLELNQKNINQIKKTALELLVLQKLKNIELDKFNITLEKNKVDQYINTVYKNDLNDLLEKFERNNLSFDLVKKEIETQLKWQRLIYRIYSKSINIDDKSIDKEITSIQANEKKVEQFNISEIAILNSDNEINKKNILEIKDQIKKFGFEDTVIKYSIAPSASSKGNLGWISAKSLSEDIYNAINNINIGEVTNPIIKSENILFFKLNNKRKTNVNNMDLTKLKADLINKKKNEIFNLYSKSHLSKIKNSSLIEYK